MGKSKRGKLFFGFRDGMTDGRVDLSGSHGRRPPQDSNTPYGGSGYCIPNFPTPEKEGKNRVFDALSSCEGKLKEAHPLPSPPPRTFLSIPTTQEKERESEKSWRIIALLTLSNP